MKEIQGFIDNYVVEKHFIKFFFYKGFIYYNGCLFGLKDAVDRIKDLQTEGHLTGVMDDRGKFIYITVEELESVAKFMKQHGRVSISDLAESSNRLINLNPDNAEVQKRLLTGVSA